MNVKQKNIALCIIFSIITCGIYGLYWFVCLTDESSSLPVKRMQPAASWH